MKTNFFKYLSIGKMEEEWGIYVTAIGCSKVVANEKYPKEKHPQSHELSWSQGRVLDNYYLVFITKGKGEFCSSLTGPTTVEEGTCFLLFPGVWHRYRPDKRSGWEEYWVGFNGRYVQQLMKSRFFDASKPFVEIGMDKELLTLFHKMADAIKGSFVGYSQQIAGITLQLLGSVYNTAQSHRHDNSPVSKAIAKAQFLLQESLEEQVDLPEIARQLPMGYSAFRRNFKEITGQSPNQYLLDLRIRRARELLESTLLSIEEVSELTGFDYIQYFSRLFKQKVGQSPMAYRRNAIRI